MIAQARHVIARCMALHTKGRTDDNPTLDRLCKFYIWLARGHCQIRNTESKLVPLIPNDTQRVIVSALMKMAYARRPIRLRVLKARKRGVSTLIEALVVFLCQHYKNQVAIMLAHQGDATEEIFQIAKLMTREYKYLGATSTMHTLRFPDTDSRFRCHTAGAESFGAGGTPSLLHRSEVALWKKNKEETHYASGESVPIHPETIIVDESTARGRELFWGGFDRGRDKADAWVSVFIPWFANRDCVFAPAIPEAQWDDDERAVALLAQKKYATTLTGSEIAWRRMKIRDLGPAIFRQEYPSTPEEAVQARDDLVLPGLHACVVDDMPHEYRSIPHFEGRVGGIDFGYHDPTAIVSAVYVDQVLYVLDVYCAAKALAHEHADHLMDGHMYFCDPSGLQARKEIEAAARGKTTAKVRSAPRAYGKSEMSIVDAEWGVVARMIREDRVRLLSGVADQLIYEADNFAYNPRTGQPDKTRSEAWGHFDCLDGLRYLCIGVETKPAPTDLPMERRQGRRSQFIGA